MKDQTIYLHIGLHKTGTSFLQKEIFPRMKQVNYIPSKDIRDGLEKIRKNALFEKDILKMRSNISDKMHKENNLISWEGLCGSYFWRERRDRIEILKDLKNVFLENNVKIIVGLREQIDLIQSLYKQYIHEGGYLHEDKFLKKLDLSKFKFTTLMERLIELFGKGNFYVYFFENFKNDKNEMLKNLFEYIGEERIPNYNDVKINVGYGELQVKLGRLFNNFLKTDLNPSGIMNFEKIRLEILHYKSPISRYILQNDISYTIHHGKYRLPEKYVVKLKKLYKNDNKMLREKYLKNLPDIYQY